jgi:hypothetical protein
VQIVTVPEEFVGSKKHQSNFVVTIFRKRLTAMKLVPGLERTEEQ